LPCSTCEHKEKQYHKAQTYENMVENINRLRYYLSDNSLNLMPEFDSRIRVLQKLNYISKDRIVLLKGKAAREMSTCSELIATELVFENLLSDLSPAESAALLSSLVFQEKANNDPDLPESLKNVQEKLLSIAERLAKVQIECGIVFDTNEWIKDNLNFRLMEIVYEWAKNKSFTEICNINEEIPEGTIVRTMVRLDETLRDFKSVGRIIGDRGLSKKMEAASQLIKRDIIFAASLYYE